MLTAPVAPHVVVPVLSSSMPVVPAAARLAERTSTDPVHEPPPPLVMRTAPPAYVPAPLPAAITIGTSLLLGAELVPTLNTRFPPQYPAEEPTVNAPDVPVPVVDPVDKMMLPEEAALYALPDTIWTSPDACGEFPVDISKLPLVAELDWSPVATMTRPD